MLEEDTEFSEEFKKVFNNADIPEVDDFTPEVLEDTYMDTEIALPRYIECPEFYKSTKILQDANGIPIGRHHANYMLDTIVYEVEYLNVHKSSLATNTIDHNKLSQVD